MLNGRLIQFIIDLFFPVENFEAVLQRASGNWISLLPLPKITERGPKTEFPPAAPAAQTCGFLCTAETRSRPRATWASRGSGGAADLCVFLHSLHSIPLRHPSSNESVRSLASADVRYIMIRIETGCGAAIDAAAAQQWLTRSAFLASDARDKIVAGR